VLLSNLITGWSRHHTAEGVVLLPPAGMMAGAIQIREQQRPLRTLRSLLEETLARCTPKIQQYALIGPGERLATSGGEYAALGVILAKTPEGDRYEHYVGMILGDDFYVSIEGICVDKGLAPLVREAIQLLAKTYYVGLGELRQRPYLYTPPADWRPVASAHVTRYYSPVHPGVPGVIHVFDARPSKKTVSDAQDRQLFVTSSSVVELDLPLPSKTFTTRHAMPCELIKQTGRDSVGRKVASYLATLVDKRFVYLSRLETLLEEENRNLPVFVEMLASTVPIPKPTNESPSAMVHWSD